MKSFSIAILAVAALFFCARSDAEDSIDKLMVYSPSWIVLANDYMDETDELIYAKEKDLFDKLLKEQVALETTGEPNWVLHKKRARIWRNLFAEVSVQYIWMRDPKSFSISSPDDPAYAGEKNPSEAISWVSSLGDRIYPDNSPLRNCFAYEIGHYAFIKLPSPLANGKSYTIRQKDGRKASLKFDDTKTLCYGIKCNQAGYLPDSSAKFAYLGQWIPVAGPVDYSAFKKFRVCNSSSGHSVFEGDIVLRSKNESRWGMKGNESYSGEDVYEMDFSSLSAPGKYFIQIQGLGISREFEILQTALGEAFYVAARGFYHQRCGCALEKPFTEWTRGVCHHNPVGKASIVGNIGDWRLEDSSKANFKHLDFDIIKQTGTMDEKFEIWGGWHDAADYDRRNSHHIPVWDLLLLYQINPSAFSDSQLNIPESGNRIPDILDEARYGIDIWKRAQKADGSVTGRIEAISHPQHRGMPDKDTDSYYKSLEDRQSTMYYAASAAMFARLVKPFSKELSDEYAASAEKAWNWASDPKNSKDGFSIDVKLKKNGEKEASPIKLVLKEKEEDFYFQGLCAAINLLEISGKQTYADAIDSKYGPHAVRFFKSWPNWTYFYAPIFLLAKSENPLISDKLKDGAKKEILTIADEAIANTVRTPYRHAWREKKSRKWGGALAPTYARYLILAYFLSGDPKYKASALTNIDFHLGCNPLGMSQTTGIGKSYVCSVQDQESRRDGIADPVPGITTYGIITIPYGTMKNVYQMEIPGIDDEKKVEILNLLPAGTNGSDGKPQIPLWRQIGPHGYHNPECNEFTVQETIGPTALMLGAFLGKDWTPSQDLKKRVPRSIKELDGFFWTP